MCQNFLYGPHGARGVCAVALLASRGPLPGKVHQGLFLGSSHPGLPCFEENALELEGFQDAGSVWAVQPPGPRMKGAAWLAG